MFTFLRNLFTSKAQYQAKIEELEAIIEHKNSRISYLQHESTYYRQAYTRTLALVSRTSSDWTSEAKARSIQAKYDQLSEEWNKLARILNRKGGWEFLNNAVMPDKLPNQFSQDEIRSLIRLCHPDRHGGSDAATKLTQKLLGMRK